MPDVIQQPGAHERHPEVFKITDAIVSTLHEWINVDGLKEPEDALSFTKSALLVRAFNLYISINTLLKNDHWEDAAIISRSLFELLLNLEEILLEDEAALSKAQCFLKYNELQKTLHLINNLDYEISTNRASEEQKKNLDKLMHLAKGFFKEFYIKKKNKWQRTWCNKSVYSLASSSKNPLRMAHYKIIYSEFSNLSHSNPYGVMTTHFTMNPEKSLDEMIIEKNNYEQKNLTNVFILSTVWILEIIIFVQSVMPSFDIKLCLEISYEIKKVMKIDKSINI